MTKVLELGPQRRESSMFMRSSAIALRPVIGLVLWLLAASAHAQMATLPHCPQTTSDLYARIRSVSLDPRQVYRIRDASIDRPSLHIDFDDGTIAFTEDICGRITGAFFEGDGEIRLRPPNRVERASLSLFTGMALLEEQFSSGYLRFNDDTAAKLQQFLMPADDAADFIKKWDDTARVLAEFDALRLLIDFSHFLPSTAGSATSPKFPTLLHAHLAGNKLGPFEVFEDASNAESLWAGQPRFKDETLFFDIWTSFTPPGTAVPASGHLDADASATRFSINATIQPPAMRVLVDVDVHVRNGGERTLLFELSRYLKIESLEVEGHPLDFIQNPAIEGTKLQRQGNDMVAVVFPTPLIAGQHLRLRFRYAGNVLSEAGNGLLYVGERGTWYPNLGLTPAQFEMEFHYPATWTLVATGKPSSRSESEEEETGASPPAEKTSHWISDQPIPVAGFNLGKYVRAEAKVGNTLVEAYGTKGVERSFPKGKPEVIQDPTFPTSAVAGPRSKSMPMIVVAPPAPSPARDAQAVADRAAKSIAVFSQWFGAYPYSSLALTQMPGNLSQGWPGLVFLSSFGFLSSQEQSDLRLDPVSRSLDSQVIAHETAHQWWGDLVQWDSYRDEWIAEGLANYASLLILEQQSPSQFHAVLEKYRQDLLSKNKEGEWLRDAGPVTLGPRLESSHFPDGYDAISYERGTWLFHMLRCMLRDSEATSHLRKAHANPDEPFFRALRRMRDQYAGKKISTQDLVHVFEQELPRPLWYENRHKLDWFLEGWINGTVMPQLEPRDIRITDKAGATSVSGTIVQKDAPDDLVTAVPVYASTPGNTLVFLGEVLADGHETPFHLSAPTDVHKIVLDPHQTILTTLK